MMCRIGKVRIKLCREYPVRGQDLESAHINWPGCLTVKKLIVNALLLLGETSVNLPVPFMPSLGWSWPSGNDSEMSALAWTFGLRRPINVNGAINEWANQPGTSTTTPTNLRRSTCKRKSLSDAQEEDPGVTTGTKVTGKRHRPLGKMPGIQWDTWATQEASTTSPRSWPC